jgi:hypothetical protein
MEDGDGDGLRVSGGKIKVQFLFSAVSYAHTLIFPKCGRIHQEFYTKAGEDLHKGEIDRCGGRM